MTAPRRQIIRPSPPTTPDRQRQLQRLRARLDSERHALHRWQSKLKRAFNTVDRLQKAIARIERQLNKMEGP